MTIGENIKILRQKNNLTQEDLANIAGVTNKAVSSWENNKKLPRMGAIQKMADYFGIKKSDIIEIETNSVQNLTDTVIIDKTTKEDINEKTKFLKEFGERIKKYRDEKNLSQEALANIVGYTSENARFSIQKIEAGKIDLPASKIQALAIALDVSIGKLMGWFDESDEQNNTKELRKEISLIKQVGQKYGQKASEAFDLYLQLDSDDQGEIRGEMKHMLKAEKYSVQKGQSNEKVM